MFIEIKVIPNARKNECIGWQGDRFVVKVKAPPDKGRANEELIDCLAESLSIAKSRIRIVSGRTSRLKKIEIEGEFPKNFFK